MSSTLAAVHSTPLTVDRAVGELANETPARILAAFADLALHAPTLASHTPCRCVGILPARYKSSRLPGKLMLPLHGKKVLQRTWEAACRAKGLDLVLIACDDEIIKKEAESWGAKVIMTSTKWINGTERLSEVVPQLPAECQIVVNIQGDEPFTNPDHVELTVSSMLACLDDPKVACAQLYAPCLGGEEEVNSTATVKVVLDMNGYCLFQSRAVIPHTKEGNYVPSYPYLKFVGVTAFRKDFIPLYATHPGTQCQLHEDVEYNKVLEMGYKIKMERIEFAEIGVNTQEDYEYLLNNYQHCADPSAEPSAEQSAEQSAAQDRAKDLVEAARQ